MRGTDLNRETARSRRGRRGLGIKTGIAALGMVCGFGAGTANAAVLVEAGDAGELPATAQSSAGVAPFGTPLDAITGVVQACNGSASCDQDMFKIYVSDPVNFSASTNNVETLLDDTMLYLFDESGRGVLATDDIDGLNYKSTLAAGSLGAGQAGVYFIAVGKAFNTPVSDLPADPSNEIFDAGLLGGATTTIGATGGGAADPVVGWFLFPLDDQIGAYRINLTGATFVDGAAPVPMLTPAALVGLILLLGACGVGALRLHASRRACDV
jgi:hypothetical protein